MALTDAQKIVHARNLAAACQVFETNRYFPGGLLPDGAARTITAALDDITANSTDVPKGKDLRADLLRVAALANLNPNQMTGYSGETTAWAASVAGVL